MRIVFWQDILSIHQAPHIRALAGHKDCEVLLVVQEEIDANREALGWTVPDFGGAKIFIAPGVSTIERLVTESPEESVHIFSGIGYLPLPKQAFMLSQSTGARIGLMAEAHNPRGWRGLARMARAQIEGSKLRTHVDFVLAMGDIGVRWYRRCGYPAAKVFPYGYFVDCQTTDTEAWRNERPGQEVRLIYLGQCIPRKGIDTLLQALSRMVDCDWALTVMGDGCARVRLSAIAGELGLDPRVTFVPAAPHAIAMQALSKSDVCILPSRWDGWGAVVNEALTCGVPVLCSDACGAASLLREPFCGEVFRAGSVSSLHHALARWVALGPRSEATTARIRAWARCINGEVAARYLLSILDCLSGERPRPTAPWASRAELAWTSASAIGS